MSDIDLNQAVLDVLERYGRPVTAPAVTVALGGVAGGVLGELPAPDIAVALQHLRGAGQVERLPACPTCGTVGEIWVPAGEAPAITSAIIGPDLAETAETLGPLIAEGEIEVGERVEVIEGECCVRASRPWRPTSRPS